MVAVCAMMVFSSYAAALMNVLSKCIEEMTMIALASLTLSTVSASELPMAARTSSTSSTQKCQNVHALSENQADTKRQLQPATGEDEGGDGAERLRLVRAFHVAAWGVKAAYSSITPGALIKR